MNKVIIAELYNLHYDNVMKYFKSYLKCHSTSEDMAQEIFLKLSQSDKLLDIENGENYLFSMARNKLIDYWRKAATDKKLRESYWQQIERNQNGDTVLHIDYDKKVVWKEIQRILTTQQLAIFNLNRLEGFSYSEISEKLNLSKSTVKHHMIAALKKIRIHFIEKNIYEFIALSICCLFL